MRKDLKSALYTWVGYSGIFLGTTAVMEFVWGAADDAAVIGGFCTGLFWLTWRRLDRENRLVRNEFSELYLCWNNPQEYERRKQRSQVAACIRKAIAAKEIAAGMTLQEIEEVLRRRGVTPDWRLKPLLKAEAGRRVVLFQEDFRPFEKPCVLLKFQNEQLVEWRL